MKLFKKIKESVLNWLLAEEPVYRARDLFVLPPKEPNEPEVWFDASTLGNFEVVGSDTTATTLNVRPNLTDAIGQLAVEWSSLWLSGECSPKCIMDMLIETIEFLEKNTEEDSLDYITNKGYEEALLGEPATQMFPLILDSKELLQRQLLEELSNARMHGTLAWEGGDEGL